MFSSFAKALTRPRAPMPDELLVGERLVPVVVRTHATARRVTLRISPCGEFLKVTVPTHAKAGTVADFLQRNRGWVAARLTARPERVAIADGTTIPFRGEPLQIRYSGGRVTAMRQAAEAEAAVLLVGGDAAHLRRRVKDFVLREARRDLEAAVGRHADAVGIRPAGLSLKDTVSRWGSCSAGRRLAFSWRIVLAPPFALDYLAAHEVAHLRVMNHGPAFWALCRELCPDMDRGRSWLRSEGAGLHAIDFG